MQHNLVRRPLGWNDDVGWSCGELPKLTGGSFHLGSTDGNPRVYEAFIAPMRALILEIGESDLFEEHIAIEQMVLLLRRRGIDVDPNNFGMALARWRANGPILSNAEIIELRLSSFAFMRGGLSLDHVQSIDDEALKLLPTNLLWLNLTATAIADAGLATLKNLDRLKNLCLDQTSVSDAAIETLALMPNLKILTLRRTKITLEGISRLQKALPNTNIMT